MIADWFAAQEAIEAAVKAAPALANVDVFTADVPAGKNVDRPYVVLKFAGFADLNRHQSIMGAKDASANGMFTTASVAFTDKDARRLSQLVRNVLIGLVPTPACGEITPAFFAGVAESSSLTSPTRYSADQAYEVTVNATL